MAVKSLSEINETRNIESSIDENTLSSGETSGGFFGTFKIFEAVKKAVNWLTNITGNKTFEGNVQINGTLKSNSPMLRDVIQVKAIGNFETVPVPVGHCVCVINAHSIYSEIALLINTDGTLGYMILAKKNTVGLTYTQTTDGYIISYGTGVGRVAYFDLFSI